MDGSVKLSLRRVFKIQRPAEVLVGGRGAGAGGCQAVLSRGAVARDKLGSVDRIVRPQVDCVIAQVVGGYEPVSANLLLQTYIPLFQIRRLNIQR
jgi:hypothetical protein